MSIEKFNPKILGESIPYAQVNIKVIQEIINLEAGFVWIYLLTLPPNWKVVKNHLRNHFGIGKLKLKRIFSYLNAHKLIEYTQSRLESGHMGPVDVLVLNGSRFIKNPLSTGGIDYRPPVQPPTGEVAPIKEIKRNKINKKKKDQEIGKKRLSSPKTAITLSFTPNENHKRLADELNLNLDNEKTMFIDYYQAHGKVMANWNSAFNNWLRKASEFKKKSNGKVHPVTAAIQDLMEKSPEFRDFLS